MKLSVIVAQIIALGEAIAAHSDRELRRRCPDYPLFRLSELGPPPPQARELRTFFHALPPAVVYLLVVLVDLGREIIDAEDDLLAAYEDTSNQLRCPRDAADYLFGKVIPPDYLQRGLEKLAAAGRDVDALLA
jgi:hypothetical protein